MITMKRQIGLGLGLVLLISLSAEVILRLSGLAVWGLSTLTLAIIIGVLLGNTPFRHQLVAMQAGLHCAKTTLLRLGIILYGVRITFFDIAQVGIGGFLIDLIMLVSTFLLAIWMNARYFKLDQALAYLIGAGSSICGAAAVIATEPIVKAKAGDVGVAVSTVVVFGTLSMCLYPLIALVWPGSELAFGIYTGASVHEVAQVVAVGKSLGDEVANAAVISKMIRVMLLAPFLLGLSAWVRQTKRQADASRSALVIPWFALFFIIVAGLNTLTQTWHHYPLWAQSMTLLIQLDTYLLAMAMAALGLTTQISQLRQHGGPAFKLAACLWLWLIIGGFILSYILFSWVVA